MKIKVEVMVITRNFKKTIKTRALQYSDFKEGFLIESIENMVTDDINTGKSRLKDYINATMGNSELAHALEQLSRANMEYKKGQSQPLHDAFTELKEKLNDKYPNISPSKTHS